MRAAWNGRDFSRMHELMHPGFTYTGPDGKEMAGPESATGKAKMFTSAFPDAVRENTQTFTDGDTVISEAVLAGTHRGEFMGIPPTGRRAELRVCNVMEMRDERVYLMREYFDMMAFMLQLGVMKMPGAAGVSA